MSRGLLLGIDSATEYLALSLVEAGGGVANAGEPEAAGAGVAGRETAAPSGGAEVARFVERLGREHAARIMPELEALLARAGAARGDVRGIGVGVGPGSYTGVRIGIATARALGRAWGVPVSGVSSLLALLHPLAPGQQGVGLIDARRGNVYAQAGVRLPGEHAVFEPLTEPVKLPREELPERFAGLPLFEGEPDAAPLARLAGAGGALDAIYL